MTGLQFLSHFCCYGYDPDSFWIHEAVAEAVSSVLDDCQCLKP